MDSDRLTQLEQRLAQVEMELTTSRRMIQDVRNGTARTPQYAETRIAIDLGVCHLGRR